MRAAVLVLSAAALLVAGALATGAVSTPSIGVNARTVLATIVRDDQGYLQITGNGAHGCFVSNTSGRTTISFGATGSGCTSQGAGTGINEGDGATSAKYACYAFHDILKIVNLATKSVYVWVNATTTTSPVASSNLSVARKTSSGAMTDSACAGADYTGADAVGGTNLATGGGASSTMYVGVRVKSGTVVHGNSVTGSIWITARK